MPLNAAVAAPALEAARAYDRWFERRWGSYAWGVELGALRRALGSTAGRRVLDVGCGTGRFTHFVAHGAAVVTGVDRDLAMLAVARERVTAPLLAGDALALPVRAASVDVTVAITVLEFVADPAAAVRELARVTRPGGTLVVGALNTRSPWGLAHRHVLREPPWDAARFLSRDDLHRLAAPYGRVRLTGALHAPGAFPGLALVGPVLERLGRFAPAFGAFQVLAVRRS